MERRKLTKMRGHPYGVERKLFVLLLLAALFLFGINPPPLWADGSQPVDAEGRGYTPVVPIENKTIINPIQTLTSAERGRVEQLLGGLNTVASSASAAPPPPTKKEPQPVLFLSPSAPSQPTSTSAPPSRTQASPTGAGMETARPRESQVPTTPSTSPSTSERQIPTSTQQESRREETKPVSHEIRSFEIPSILKPSLPTSPNTVREEATPVPSESRQPEIPTGQRPQSPSQEEIQPVERTIEAPATQKPSVPKRDEIQPIAQRPTVPTREEFRTEAVKPAPVDVKPRELPTQDIPIVQKPAAPGREGMKPERVSPQGQPKEISSREIPLHPKSTLPFREIKNLNPLAFISEKIQNGLQEGRQKIREHSLERIIRDFREIRKIKEDLTSKADPSEQKDLKAKMDKMSVPENKFSALFPGTEGKEVALGQLFLNPDEDIVPYLRLLLFRRETDPNFIKAYLASRQKLRLRSALARIAKEKPTKARYTAYPEKMALKRLKFADGTVVIDKTILPAKNGQKPNPLLQAPVEK